VTLSPGLLATLIALPLGPAKPAAAPLSDPGAAAGAVTLADQSAQVDTGAVVTLELRARVVSTLPVAVRAVRLGVLYARDQAALTGVDAASLYRRGSAAGAESQVGVVDRRVEVALGPRGDARLELTVPIPPGGPPPEVFQTHVLGYELAELSPGVVFELLSTQAASDEVAAVQAFGLDGERDARLAARRRWASRAADLVPGFVRELERPVAERPTEADTFRRVLAVRALGVLGGTAAERALRQHREDVGLSRFDEPLQVLRIARVVGSPLETPLAFAVPADVQRLAELYTVALGDCASLEIGTAAGPAAPDAAPAAGSRASSAPPAGPGSPPPVAVGAPAPAAATATAPGTTPAPVAPPAAAGAAASAWSPWAVVGVVALLVLAAASALVVGRRRR
jgi:hypothetical protein